MEISLGAVTYHHFRHPIQRHFERCVGDCQTILNPLVSVGFGNDNFFAGANSLARPMAGYRRNFPINSFTNFTVGSYYQNMGEFDKRGVTMPYTMGDFVPIVGFDLNYKMAGLLITAPVSVFYIKF